MNRKKETIEKSGLLIGRVHTKNLNSLELILNFLRLVLKWMILLKQKDN